jgi:hypothetical protein
MDADRFDALTRSLDPGSRRRILGIVAGVGLGAFAPLRAMIDAEAGKKKKPKCEGKSCGCRTLGSYCHGICEPNTACSVCCSGYCGFYDDTNDSLCCAKHGDACPSGCKKNQRCHGCCNNGICDSGGHCFAP